jgi:hypothetical protein
VLRGEIPADRILYMTATPKRFARARQGSEAVSMDEAGGFGRRVFDFTLDQAVAAAVIADYRVVVAAVERDVFDRVARQLDEDIDPHLLAGAIAVVRSMGEYQLGSCLSFHSRVDRARRFAELVGAVAEVLHADRPAHPGWAGFVHGNASVRIRRRLLARLSDRHSWGVLANAKALGEGVDVPTLDAVAIVDPKQSDTDVLQACGRALRRPTDTKVGTVILPVLLTAHADPDDPLAGADPKSIELVSGVLRALRAHDADLGRRLDVARRSLARTRVTHDSSFGHRLRRIAARRLLRTRIELHVPDGPTGELAGAIALHVVRDATSSWEEAFARLEQWIADHGALPAQGERVPDETGTFSLGAWCSSQRTDYNKGLLAPERAARLNALPLWTWSPRDEQWWRKFAALKDYVDTHGALPRGDAQSMFRVEHQGVRVYQFAASCRAAVTPHDGAWLLKFPDRVAALEALPGWAWNTKDAEWETSFGRLERWVKLTGDAAPSVGNLVDGQDVGKWVLKQRSRIRATLNGDTGRNTAAALSQHAHRPSPRPAGLDRRLLADQRRAVGATVRHARTVRRGTRPHATPVRTVRRLRSRRVGVEVPPVTRRPTIDRHTGTDRTARVDPVLDVEHPRPPVRPGLRAARQDRRRPARRRRRDHHPRRSRRRVRAVGVGDEPADGLPPRRARTRACDRARSDHRLVVGTRPRKAATPPPANACATTAAASTDPSDRRCDAIGS